jgi:hypothetical protein
MPVIQEITSRDDTPAGELATALEVLDLAAGERHWLPTSTPPYPAATTGVHQQRPGQLANLCAGNGRLAEVLALTEQKADYTRQAGLGPWTQPADKGRRLQALAEMGQATCHPRSERSNDLWNVREVLLGIGRSAARQPGRWQDALDLNAATLACMCSRNAPAAEAAGARLIAPAEGQSASGVHGRDGTAPGATMSAMRSQIRSGIFA